MGNAFYNWTAVLNIWHGIFYKPIEYEKINSYNSGFYNLYRLHGAKAQQTVRIGYVDMEYILENVPEYQEASAQLEKKVQQWKQEIETELTGLKK